MKKLLVLIVASLLMVGLTGCDLFSPDDVPPVCDEGYELVGTECVLIETEGDAPVITLTGNASITIAVGDAFSDPGATATDTEDGNLTTSIVVTGQVNVNAAGTYTISYDVTDSDGNAATTVTRIVTVVQPGDNDPVITLVGSATITLNAGDTFTDQGATATDVEDGNLTSSIVKTGTVNTATPGVYVITYTVTDSDMNSASVVRTVTVLPSDAQVLANYIVDNWDGTLQFLGLTMANMDFSTAMNMTFEVDFEVTEDIDETHYVSAVITDQWVYDEMGDTLHRTFDIDVDGEIAITVNMIVQEVETGVHLYIEYRPILDMLQQQDPEMIDMLGWVGFDDQWALFQLDDTLQNVVEVAVVKDMIVSLFFSEMGENFFYDVQEQMIEQAIGFDLTQYGVDLGAFIDLLIEEDFVAAEAMLQAIQVENIVLHLDHMYIAWHLYELLGQFEADLLADGFATTKLELLNTATYNELTGEMDVNLPIDPLEGTQAFFESLTPAELDSLVEIVIKPTLEMMIYGQLLQDVNPEWLQGDFEAMMGDYQTFLEENWPESSDPFVFADEFAALQAEGAVAYWQALSWDEQSIFWWAIDHHNRSGIVWLLDDYMYRQDEFQPMLVRYGYEVDYNMVENAVLDVINGQLDYLMTTYSIDGNNWLAQLQTQEVHWWFHELSTDDRNVISELFSLPGYEHYQEALGNLYYMSQRPWDFQYWYESEYVKIGVDHATWSIESLLRNHQTYLETNYGYDVDALVTEIFSYEHKGIEWYLYYASQTDRDVLHEIADFEWEDHYYWTLDQLDELLYNQGDFRVFYGRNFEQHDFYYLNEQVEWMLWDNKPYITANYPGVDVQYWVDSLWMDGLPIWWDNLSQGDRDILIEVSNFNNGMYRWPIELMQMRDDNPGEFHVGTCSWDFCIEDEWITMDLVQLINDNTGFFEDNGYNVANLIADIEMVGAADWFLYYASDNDRDMLYQIAEWGNWRYEVLHTLDNVQWQQEDLLDWLYTHEAELNTIGFNATQKIADLELYGIQVFLDQYLTEADIALLMDTYVYPKIEGLFDAIDAQEVPEYLIELIFANPHMDELLGMLEPTEYFDPFDVLDIDNLQANLLAIDFDALALETVDLEALANAIYEGPTAYSAFLLGLETTAPNSERILSLFAPAVEEAQPYMTFVDDINYAFEGLTVFEHFFTPDYWLNESGMDIELDVTPEFYVNTTMVMDPIMYQLVLQDLLDDLNTYLMGFTNLPFPYDANWECVPDTSPYYDEYCEDMEISNLMAILTQLGDIGINVTFDPSDPTWMQLQLDATDFLDVVVYKSNEWILDDPSYVADNNNDILTGVNNATITITMSEGGDIVLPDAVDVDDVNEIAYEFGKFGVAMFARDYLREMMWHYDQNPDELADLILAGPQTYSLSEFYFLRASKAFDLDMSTIGVTINNSNPLAPKPEFNLTLYWVDGTEALNGTVTYAQIAALFDQDNDLIGQTAFDTMKGFVNETNYNMTKLWLMFLFQEAEHQMNDEFRR